MYSINTSLAKAEGVFYADLLNRVKMALGIGEEICR